MFLSRNPAALISEPRSGGRILIVDDDEQVCRLLARIVRDAGYEVASHGSARGAREELRRGDISVLIADVNLPGGSGIELVREALAEFPDLAALMISGVDDTSVVALALDCGAYGYLTKPVRAPDVVIAVMNAIRRRDRELAQRVEHDSLQRLVAERTAAVVATIEQIESAAVSVARLGADAVSALARAVECRDVETGAHIERMSFYCGLVADRVGLDANRVRLASQLHDLGKIGVPDRILRKPGALTADERALMQRHTVIGYQMLGDSYSDLLKLGATIALTHHERWDGDGYPAGLSGCGIPIEGRIAAIADVFDALTTDRVYRNAIGVAEAVETMRAERGTHFDPELFDRFRAALPEIEARLAG